MNSRYEYRRICRIIEFIDLCCLEWQGRTTFLYAQLLFDVYPKSSLFLWDVNDANYGQRVI